LATKDVITVHSVIEDLWRRDGLIIAIGGRDSSRLQPLLEYCIYAMAHPHLSQTTIHLIALILDLYSGIIGVSNEIDYLFCVLNEVLNNLIDKHKILLKLQGSIEMILNAQDIINNPLNNNNSDIVNLKNTIHNIVNNIQNENDIDNDMDNDIDINNCNGNNHNNDNKIHNNDNDNVINNDNNYNNNEYNNDNDSDYNENVNDNDNDNDNDDDTDNGEDNDNNNNNRDNDDDHYMNHMNNSDNIGTQ